ncbi:ABC transporter permease [Georgenia sp. SUBG003]|uniref:ABC transporter permease n=1 Tax=Georgenia sp. SUBG003 TaxID=1497974 RepID=UPI0004D5D489|nr:hypothetical protein DA06_07125 [Georgenia sp. SUBG003]
MSTTAPSPRPSTAAPRPPAPADAARPVPFLRLARVELRKQVDTRAGAWLLTVIVVINAGFIALMLLTAEPEVLTWRELTLASTWGQMILLPLLGILAATGEWSQRTALTTFALEPRRARVNAAKLVSAVGLGLAVMAFALASGAVLNVVGIFWRDGDGSWAMEWSLLGGLVLSLVLLVTQGVAFGLALLSTPVAIVAYLGLPTVWSILGMTVAALREPARWLDINSAMLPLMGGQMDATRWAQLATSTAVWVLLPLTLGLWRTARRDVA